MRRRVWHGVLALLVAAIAASCEETPIDPGPIGPSPDPIFETFSGTLSVNGGVTFPFVVAQAGSITASLTALAPDPAAVLGLGVGIWTGTTCDVRLVNDNASLNSQVQGTVNNSAGGTLCARVFDSAGKLTEPITFTISVAHF